MKKQCCVINCPNCKVVPRGNKPVVAASMVEEKKSSSKISVAPIIDFIIKHSTKIVPMVTLLFGGTLSTCAYDKMIVTPKVEKCEKVNKELTTKLESIERKKVITPVIKKKRYTETKKTVQSITDGKDLPYCDELQNHK